MFRALPIVAVLAGLVLAGCRPARSAARSQGKPDKPEVVETPPPVIHPAARARAQAHIEKLMRDYDGLQSRLETVRSQLDLLSRQLRTPWIPDASEPWRELVRRRMLWDEPVNPFSPPEVASKLLVVDRPGADGASVSPKTAGWVWNSTDETLDAAWNSAAIRACGREARRRHAREKAGPRLDQTLKILRGQVTMFRVFDGNMWEPGQVEGQQWKPLIRAGYLAEAPSNPMSPPDVSRRVVEIATPGAGGDVVDPQMAGWVWNSADGQFYAAGYDDRR